MRKFLLSTAAVAVLGGAAYAAEPLAPFAPPPPPVVEPFIVPTWAGPYIGADIGWGWADIGGGVFGLEEFDHDHAPGIHRHHRRDNRFFDSDLDGLVGGVFAGWLGQNGTFLYGVEIFGQLADIDSDDRRFNPDHFLLEGERVFVQGNQCFFEAAGIATQEIPCNLGRHKVHALFGLEGMIGWGGDRSAFLLHAGPALGWFQSDDAFLVPGARVHDDDEIEFGLSVAAEGRVKLTESVFAGVIGRAVWFPDVADDRGRFFANNGIFRHHGRDDDVTVFEVKARLGVMFGQPPAAAPIEAAF